MSEFTGLAKSWKMDRCEALAIYAETGEVTKALLGDVQYLVERQRQNLLAAGPNGVPKHRAEAALESLLVFEQHVQLRLKTQKGVTAQV